MRTISIVVQNLKCSGCASTIENKLNHLFNIANVDIDVENSIVMFDYEDELALLDAKETLKILGYPEVGEVNSLGTRAKSYMSCAIGKMS
jgi:copper chaperone